MFVSRYLIKTLLSSGASTFHIWVSSFHAPSFSPPPPTPFFCLWYSALPFGLFFYFFFFCLQHYSTFVWCICLHVSVQFNLIIIDIVTNWTSGSRFRSLMSMFQWQGKTTLRQHERETWLIKHLIIKHSVYRCCSEGKQVRCLGKGVGVKWSTMSLLGSANL